MKFLVLGASGMAGHVISLYLKERGHDVTGFDRRNALSINCILGDAKDTQFLRKMIKDGNYDAVINAVGILNQFAESNHADAAFLNGFFPHFLADITKDMQTQVIHMSTDCVFSGKTGGYQEDALRDGETFYDRSKALGELKDDKNITFRNSIVGPDINPNGIGLLNWFMQQNGKIYGYTGAMWTGMTTLQLAKVMESAAKQRAHGLYNMVPDHNISKYDLLQLINHYLRADSVQIEPYGAFVSDKTLIRSCFEFAEIVPDYELMVREMSAWIHTHNFLYPHYSL